jgi:hypothetical protein
MHAAATHDIEHPVSGRGFVLMSLAALVAVATAQLADLMTFLRMVAEGGIAAEANPIVAGAAILLGVNAVVLAKLGLIAFVAMTVAILAPVSRRLAGSVLTLGTLAGLVGATSNVLALA